MKIDAFKTWKVVKYLESRKLSITRKFWDFIHKVLPTDYVNKKEEKKKKKK